MGVFRHPVTLYSPSGDRAETVEAVVDTGSTFTWIPAPILQRLGIQAELEDDFILANGQIIRRGLAEVRAQLDGERRTIVCVFDPENSEPLLGAHSLEAFRLAADPTYQRLVPARNYAL